MKKNRSKNPCLLSSFFLLSKNILDKHSSPIEATLGLIYTRNIAFSLALALHPFLVNWYTHLLAQCHFEFVAEGVQSGIKTGEDCACTFYYLILIIEQMYLCSKYVSYSAFCFLRGMCRPSLNLTYVIKFFNFITSTNHTPRCSEGGMLVLHSTYKDTTIGHTEK